MAMSSRPLLVLLVGSVVAIKPECGKPTLLTLRGGVIDNNGAYRRPGYAYRPQGPAPAQGGSFLSDLSNEQEQMSDAERVYVVQQFRQRSVQKAFLKRVYAILSVQLAATMGLAITIRANRALLLLLLRQQWVLYLVFLGSLLTLSLSRKAREEAPLNGLLLSAFTLAQGAMVGVMTSMFPAQVRGRGRARVGAGLGPGLALALALALGLGFGLANPNPNPHRAAGDPRGRRDRSGDGQPQRVCYDHQARLHRLW